VRKAVRGVGRLNTALGPRVLHSLLLTLVLLAASVVVMPVSVANAATSPVLAGAAGYSALGGAAVTCTGPTTTTGAVGVSPGSSITIVPVCTFGGGTNITNASANAAQAGNLNAFGTLDQPCDHSYPDAQELSGLSSPSSPLLPGVYCSVGSFLLTGHLYLAPAPGVWIFKTVSTLITSSGSSVTGGDPCNVWWRIGSAATLGTTTSFIGNILTRDAADVTALNTGATLNGRVLVGAAGTLTLNNNTITGPTCASSGGGGGGGGGPAAPAAPAVPAVPTFTG
jgi:hypothetical protein